MQRRVLLGALMGVPFLSATGLATAPESIMVALPIGAKRCAAWADELRAGGLMVDTAEVSPTLLETFRERLDIPPELYSCHSAFIARYFIEGPVPAADIRRLLVERPDALGLAIPARMDLKATDGRRREDTLLVTRFGSTRIFARHG